MLIIPFLSMHYIIIIIIIIYNYILTLFDISPNGDHIDVNSILQLKGYRNIVTKMNTDSTAHGPADTAATCEESIRHMVLLTQLLPVKEAA